MDQLPDKREKNEAMKRFLQRMPDTHAFQNVTVRIPPDGISEIDSKKHRILQALDVLIGSLGYRMNRLHEVKGPDGKRGKRTRAKEKLYRLIYQRLRETGIKNIGITTGIHGNPAALWWDPIRLWRLQPKDVNLDHSWTKGNRFK